MIAVIFEAEPAEGRRDAYLDIAAGLRDELEEMDGFISIERFESLGRPGKLLSLSFWRDEEAVRAWRCRPRHRAAQTRGRGGVCPSNQTSLLWDTLLIGALPSSKGQA